MYLVVPMLPMAQRLTIGPCQEKCQPCLFFLIIGHILARFPNHIVIRGRIIFGRPGCLFSSQICPRVKSEVSDVSIGL